MFASSRQLFTTFKDTIYVIGEANTPLKRLCCASLGVLGAIGTIGLIGIGVVFCDSLLYNFYIWDKYHTNPSTSYTLWSYFHGIVGTLFVGCLGTSIYSIYKQIYVNTNCCSIIKTSLSGTFIVIIFMSLTYICYYNAYSARKVAQIYINHSKRGHF